MANETYQQIISKLPKPDTAEEQYLYSIACAVAGVPYETPYKGAFWKKEQYLKAMWEIAKEKVLEPTVPTDSTVTTEKIVNGAITNEKLANSSISEDKISNGAVSARKLSNGAVTEDKLADDSVGTTKLKDMAVTADKIASGAIINEKLAVNSVGTLQLIDGAVTSSKIQNGAISANNLASGAVMEDKISNMAITEVKLSIDVQNKLLSLENVTTYNLQNSAVTIDKLAQGVVNLLLAVGHVGIIQQNIITPIDETSGALTLDVLKDKINEIISVLYSAEITR